MASVTQLTEIIDTHIHMEDEAFTSDREAVFERAMQQGVSTMINAGSTVAANQTAFSLFQSRDSVFYGVGIHPHEFPATSASAFDDMREQLGRDKVVALGEIGLDYHVFPDYPPPQHEAQQEAFIQQLKIAAIFELPLIIHVREAYEDALELIKQYGPFRNGGVMHCFSGGLDYLPQVIELGLHIGIGGPVTYPKAKDVRDVVRQVPMERLLLETDGPYLPPQSKRGKRNESAYLPEVIQTIAAERGMAATAVCQQTTQNAKQLFKLGVGKGRFVYVIKGHLYVNLTNRCSADCVFCPRHQHRLVQSLDLTLDREPRADEIIQAIGDPTRYLEIVFCGFGEPMLRLATLLAVAQVVKSKGGRVRVDTIGHADIIFNKDILPLCKGRIDEWSVSLNSSDAKQYADWVRPAYKKDVLSSVVSFIGRAVQAGFPVTASAVELPGLDVEKVKALCKRLGARYRGRAPQQLGEPEEM